MTRSVIHNVVLRRLTTQDLTAIVGWFQDPDTSRFLGGPDWPAAMLANAQRAVGTDFRGARQTAADHFLALTNGVPVGYIDCGTFDRCAIYGGEGQHAPIILETIDASTGAIAFTVDPARRREGLATEMIRALIAHPDLGAVELFEAGVEPENDTARRTLETAGFHLRSPEPDCEEMLYYELWVPGRRGDRRGRCSVART
jgi:RimJ/RimL family protein N-acetyltransferase